MIQFGQKIADADYLDRPGAYAVIFNGSNQIAVVEYQGKLFLPGGGMKGDENPEEALIREVEEETGWKILVGELAGIAGDHIFASSENKYYNKIGYFFRAEIIENVSNGEPDHIVRWVKIEELKNKTTHASHVWAVKQAINSKI